MIRFCTLSLCCSVLLALALPAGAQFGGPANVNVASVELREIPSSITLVGTVEPLTRSTIGAEMAGLVEAMPIRQGDFVRAGYLICKLKDDTTRLQLAESQERLKALQSTLRKWEYEQERIKRLYGQDDAAEKEVYDTQASFDLARYTVAQQEAVIDRLQNDLEKTEIRAPFSGFIVSRTTEVGQWLVQGGDVVEMVDLSTVLVRVDVPEQALPFVRSGDAASVKLEALQRRFEGRVRHIMLQADDTARTFPVEIAVPNPGYVEVDGQPVPRWIAQPQAAPSPGSTPPGNSPGAEPESPAATTQSDLLAGGMFARVTIKAGPTTPSPSVPKDAVVTRDGMDFVAMVVPGQEEGSLMAIPSPVTTGVDIGDWIAITSGNLAPGMQVVTIAH